MNISVEPGANIIAWDVKCEVFGRGVTAVFALPGGEREGALRVDDIGSCDGCRRRCGPAKVLEVFGRVTNRAIALITPLYQRDEPYPDA